MNPEITPEQKQQLNSWALQRDNLLGDLAVKQIENDRLATANKELAVSLTRVQNEINQSMGRLEEMTFKEDEFNTLLGVQNAELNSQKTYLETRVMDLRTEISILESQKESLIKTLQVLSEVNEKVFGRTKEFDENIEKARKISAENLTETNNLLIALKGEFKKIIDVNAENVEKTNVVINQLPRIIFDLQKDILERKQFNRHKVTPQ
jgi:hypothetical protein